MQLRMMLVYPTPLSGEELATLACEGEITLEVENQHAVRGSTTAVVNALLALPIGVSAGFVANWLYDHLKRVPPSRVRIEHRETIFDKGELQRIIEDSYEEQ
ncbi:MAG: hypothetical protein ACYC6T_18120 [Thermoleophilia bacterium]